MKIFNNHPQQRFQLDYVDPVTAITTRYLLKPNRATEVPDRLAETLLKSDPQTFTVDDEARDTRAESKKLLEERDGVIADLTKQVLLAEARADKAEAALEAFADAAEKAAEETPPTASLGSQSETAEPAAPVAEVAKKQRKPKFIA